MNVKRSPLLLALCASGLAVSTALGQTTMDPPAPSGSSSSVDLQTQRSILRSTYGVFSFAILQIPAAAFKPADASATLQEDGQGYIYSSTGAGRFFAPVNLPNGALVSFLDLYYNDTDASNFNAILFEFTGTNIPNVNTVAQVSSIGSSGPGYEAFFINPAKQIDNENQYSIYVFSTNSARKFKALNVWYKLQVSPAPGSATFGDVPTSHPFFRAIEALASSGITSGCGGGNFCPDQNVTRGEVAKFLANALGLHFPL